MTRSIAALISSLSNHDLNTLNVTCIAPTNGYVSSNKSCFSEPERSGIATVFIPSDAQRYKALSYADFNDYGSSVIGAAAW